MNIQQPSAPRLLKEAEAAAILNIEVATLRRWRWAGKPNLPFHKIGAAVRYESADLSAFIEAGRRNSTSSEFGPKAA